MRIAYLAAGAAGMYCGSCLHDNTLAAALLDLGEDVLLVPTYTPLRTDEPNVSQRRVFFGGVNAYLQQISPLFRRTPRWFDRLLDNSTLLRYVTSGAGSVDPAKLGAMTVSMLRGESGNQSKSVDQIADWLVDEVQPEVIHLSNSMLLGMARRITERGGPPIVCALSGEDLFLEALRPPYYDQARALLCERAAEIAGFTALNGYYADHMATYLGVDRSKIHVVPHGLKLDGVMPRDHASEATNTATDLYTIGYLARLCPAKGLHLLVEACELLAEHRPDLPIELRAAGYLGSDDRKYLIDLHRQVDRGPLAGRFHYHGELNRDQKYDFLRSLTLFSTPTVHAEAKGLPAMEAMAVGTPVVLPRHGSFTEMISDSAAGILHDPQDPGSLAEALESLLDDPEGRRRHGEAGLAATRQRYHARHMAEATMAVYEAIVSAADAV